MVLYRVLRLICLVIPIAVASPVPLADDTFNKILRNVPSEESVITMRNFEDSNDRQFKQISLSSLIGDLQNNLYDAAISLTNKDLSVLGIKTNTKRQSLTNEKKNSEIITKLTTTTESETMLPVTNKVIFQPKEEIPQLNSVPAHIIIDRFDIQTHTGGLESIPIFELKQTENNNSADTDHNITMPKTSLTTTPPNHFGSSSTTKSSTSGATSFATSTTAATTPKNIDHLKEAEAELKEKISEIEAEPIILSARI